MEEEEVGVVSFDIDEDDDDVLVVSEDESTSNVAPVVSSSDTDIDNAGVVSFDIDEEVSLGSTWETDKINITEELPLGDLDVDQQTALSLLDSVPVVQPNLAEEIDARIQQKFEEHRDAISASNKEKRNLTSVG